MKNSSIIRILNARLKEVKIDFYKGKKVSGYRFTSDDEECNFVYASYNLMEAIEAYEEETAYQLYTHYEYWSEDEKIIEQLNNICPF